jgi:hypothetical protein
MKYKLVLISNVNATAQAWPFQCAPTLRLLDQVMSQVNKTFQWSGSHYSVSDSMGEIVQVNEAKVINNKTGRVLVQWSAPLLN